MLKKLKLKNTNEKAITLIALIITIIVLLILATVTIATLTGNNGILIRATYSSRKTEISSVKEQAKLDIANWVAEELKNGREGTISDWEEIKNILDTANPNTENRYYVDVTEEGVETPNGYLVPIDELYTTRSSEEETTSKTIEDLSVGDRVYYDTGNTSVGNQGVIECIVLYDSSSEYGVQIIAADTVDTVTLGDSNFDTSRDSYNNSLKILYDKAQEYLNPKYASGARCVGSKPNDPDWDTSEMFIADSSYTYMNDYNNIFKVEDENYNLDWIQMESITNVNIKTSNSNYWLASRKIYSNSNRTTFDVYFAYGMTGVLVTRNYGLGDVLSSGSKYGMSHTQGFRPVFILQSGIKVIEGNDKIYTLVL